MKIVFVCAGNLFRSVISECLFEIRARDLLGDVSSVFDIESSGLEADAAMPPHPDCTAALESIGVATEIKPPVKTDESQLESADMVVAMTRQQSYVMASRFPEQRRKCFSLLEVNGAVWTMMDGRELPPDDMLTRAAGEVGIERLDAALREAASRMAGASREFLYPIAGVPLNIRELMTLFPPCFYQASAIHDPMSGTAEDRRACARQLDVEISLMLRGLIALALDLDR